MKKERFHYNYTMKHKTPFGVVSTRAGSVGLLIFPLQRTRAVTHLKQSYLRYFPNVVLD